MLLTEVKALGSRVVLGMQLGVTGPAYFSVLPSVCVCTYGGKQTGGKLQKQWDNAQHRHNVLLVACAAGAKAIQATESAFASYDRLQALTCELVVWNEVGCSLCVRDHFVDGGHLSLATCGWKHIKCCGKPMW